MGQFYKHPNKESCFSMARDYDTAQKIESRFVGDSITMHWAKPRFDNGGVWYLQKPSHLECSVIVECYPGVTLVDGADIDWPDPEEL